MVRHPLLATLTLAVVATFVVPGVALAEPGLEDLPPATLEDTRALAREIQARIDENGVRISALAEELNGAHYRLEQIEAEIADAQGRIDEAERQVDRRRRDVNQRAASAYKRAGTGGALDILNVSDPQERNARAKYAGAAAASDAKLVVELQAAQGRLAEHRREREVARDAATTERDALAEKATAIQQANADQAFLLDNVNVEIQTLIDEERSRREAELALLVPGAPLTPPPSGGAPVAAPTPPDPPPSTPPPPPTNRAQIALDFARAQLGKPYCFGGNGWGRHQPAFGIDCPPDTYDCSGLTMRAWGAAGILMPHYSGAQYAMFPKVALHALQPGDLVFYGPGGSQHVGIYIGNAQMINAPQTGDVVRVAPIYRSSGGPVGAVRPG